MKTAAAEGGFRRRGALWVMVGLLLATSVAFPTVAAQEPATEPYTVVMIPPYTRSDAGGDLVAVADHHTGFLAVDGAIVNAVDGDGASGWAWIEMDHVLAENASIIDYEIALDRSVAFAFRGDVSMGAFATSSDGLKAGAWRHHGTGPVTLSFPLQDPDGVIAAGTIKLRIEVAASLRGCGPPFSFLPCSFSAEAAEATVRSITATVHPAPPEPPNTPPTARFMYSCSALDCAFDGSASTDAEDGVPSSYAWDFGDGATGAGATVDHEYAAAGSYAVTLTVTDDDGATDSTSHEVSVSEPPPNTPPTASFTYSCTDLSCDSDGTGSADPDGSIAVYDWDFGDGATGTGATASHGYDAAGTYTVTLTVTDDDGASDSTSQEVTVSEPPPPEIHLEAHGYKEKGLQKTDLVWTNATSGLMDVYRDGVVVATIENDGAHTDPIDARGKGSYVYRVCEAGTATCSDDVVVEF